MNLDNFKPEEFINQFEAKLERDGANSDEVRAFQLGVLSAISSMDSLIEKGANTTELTTICREFGTALKGGEA